MLNKAAVNSPRASVFGALREDKLAGHRAWCHEPVLVANEVAIKSAAWIVESAFFRSMGDFQGNGLLR